MMSESIGKGSWKQMTFKSHGDERGALVAINGSNDVPFEIKRVYYMTGNSFDMVRGLHAHKKLEQVLIAISGSVTIKVTDGQNTEIFKLTNRTQGLLIKDLVWREIYGFSNDCVLMVLASDIYNPKDYIHDYKLFQSYSEKIFGDGV